MQHHRHSGVNEVVRILPCTCGRATLDARRLLLLISGGVERNPGAQMRGAQWNSGSLSQTKRAGMERKLREKTYFCPLQETRLAPAECAALKIGACQRTWRTPDVGEAYFAKIGTPHSRNIRTPSPSFISHRPEAPGASHEPEKSAPIRMGRSYKGVPHRRSTWGSKGVADDAPSDTLFPPKRRA
ncbi:hypothetical protein ERJ75_000168700 [Trypanosoma vivax]|nr:hypothetical protein ERJ75_000168700 [Trypanosoma vivax]